MSETMNNRAVLRDSPVSDGAPQQNLRGYSQFRCGRHAPIPMLGRSFLWGRPLCDEFRTSSMLSMIYWSSRSCA